MKKIYLLMAGLILASGASMAQERKMSDMTQKQGYLVKTLHSNRSNLMEKGTTTDTAGLIEGTGNFEPVFDFSDPAMYGSVSGGYIYGFNADSVCMTAQGYINNGGPHSDGSTIEIKEVIMWVGSKDDAGVGTTLEVNVYDMGPGNAVVDFATFDPQTGDGTGDGPGYTALATATVALSACDTSGGFTSVMLASPVSVTGGFAIGINVFSWIDGNDTIGIVGDADGSGYNMAYQSSQPGYWWYTVEQGWGGLNQNIALWAVIGDNNVGIDSEEYFNGVQLSAYPVPATTNTTIAFNLSRDFNDVVVKVMDSHGKVVYRNAMGTLSQGEYKEVVDVTALAAGNYYYTLYAEGTKLTKKFVVVK